MENSKTFAHLALTLFNLIPESKARNKNHTSFFGITSGLANKLAQLTIAEQHSIALRASSFMTMHIDETALAQLILDVGRDKELTELEDQYIFNFATNTMMRQLFGMHTTEFCARRKLLGLAGQGQHRPQYCNEETEVLIWEQWQKYQELDDRERYLKVSDVTGQPLNIVWPAIQRYME